MGCEPVSDDQPLARELEPVAPVAPLDVAFERALMVRREPFARETCDPELVTDAEPVEWSVESPFATTRRPPSPLVPVAPAGPLGPLGPMGRPPKGPVMEPFDPLEPEGPCGPAGPAAPLVLLAPVALLAPVVLFAPELFAPADAAFEVDARPAALALEPLADPAEEPDGTHAAEAPSAPPIVMPMTPTATPAAARRLKPVFVYMGRTLHVIDRRGLPDDLDAWPPMTALHPCQRSCPAEGYG